MVKLPYDIVRPTLMLCCYLRSVSPTRYSCRFVTICCTASSLVARFFFPSVRGDSFPAYAVQSDGGVNWWLKRDEAELTRILGVN
ncbi:hypothetical protein R1flu_027763 [Riccia fluitans]|uniref:Uncharacterized protein n=1 Tax=Riccia fluitans TaxID=41844 RepID=A0ABD1XK78_9MARC